LREEGTLPGRGRGLFFSVKKDVQAALEGLRAAQALHFFAKLNNQALFKVEPFEAWLADREMLDHISSLFGSEFVVEVIIKPLHRFFARIVIERNRARLSDCDRYRRLIFFSGHRISSAL